MKDSSLESLNSMDEEYELFMANSMYPDLEKAIEIVKEFIIAKKLVLKGGQAIEFALRSKGGALYSDHAIPDYDFYSSNHYEDAAELGEILCQAGMPNVSVIHGMHLQTERVRVNFETVADIAYCPPALLDHYHVITWNRFRIIHPHHQMIDQLRSLAYPLENEPAYNAINRWKKDMDRFNLLHSYFPVKADRSDKADGAGSITIPIADLEGAMISGPLGLAYWAGKFKVKDKSVVFECSTADIFYNANDKRLSGKEAFNPILNTVGPRWQDGTIARYEVRGMVSSYPATNIGTKVYAACGPHIMSMLLLSGDHTRFVAAREMIIDGSLPYGTLEVFGLDNRPDFYLLNLMKAEGKSNLVPKNLYYEECGGTHKLFDYSVSPFFQFGGELVEKS